MQHHQWRKHAEKYVQRPLKKTRDALSRMLQECEDSFPEKLLKGRPPKRAVEFEINTIREATPPSRPPYRLLVPRTMRSSKLKLTISFPRDTFGLRKAHMAPQYYLSLKRMAGGVCVDYRALNKQTVKDRYPLPCINYLIDRLGRARYFTTLDLASGYHQIAMKNADIHRTAFRTQRG